jgi:hypothetical protein
MDALERGQVHGCATRDATIARETPIAMDGGFDEIRWRRREG